MKKIIKVQSDANNDHLRIEYMVGNYCNFKCWYCGPHANGGTHRWNNDYDLLLKNFSHLFEHYIKQGKKTFELNYVGGEPTLWPEIGKFTREIKQKFNCKVTINTNGSRTLRWWENNAEVFDKIKFSCHPNEVDIEHYITVLDLVYEKGVNLNALIMMDPTNWDKSIEIIERCKKSKYPWFVNAVEVHSKYKYTEEQKKYINRCVKRMPGIFWILKHENIFQRRPKVIFEDGKKKSIYKNWITLNGQNQFNGWKCNLGIDSINIQKDGIITGVCGMKLYNKDFYYNIYDTDFVEKFNPELVPVICKVDYCWCQPETLINKIKI